VGITIPKYEDDGNTLRHGSYLLEIYATSDIEGMSEEDKVFSNSLYFDIMWINEENKTFIIASSFAKKDALQYEKIKIPYYIYRTDGAS
jgi:hypothetical protein